MFYNQTCRSSPTSWRRTTALLGFRSRRLGLTNQLKMEADGEEMKIIFVFKFSDPMKAQSSSAHNCESGINPGHSRNQHNILNSLIHSSSL